MEARELRTVLILADISGYTRYMVENQLAAVHGQTVITFLIETILREVDIPLKLHGIEGDAVFLSAAHPGDDDEWRHVLDEVRRKLLRFFEVFLDGIVRMAESTPCGCPSCRNVDSLKLKIIVHTGTAVYHTIAGLAQIAGTDVILAHRLLKNSVPSDEYLLMTESAYRDLGQGMPGEFHPGEEQCDGIGTVRTMVRLMGPDRDHAREAFYARPADEIAREGKGYVAWMLPAIMTGLRKEIQDPRLKVSLPRRLGFAALFVLQLPVALYASYTVIPKKLAEQRAARQSQKSAS